MADRSDVLVVGGGPAGAIASIVLARAGVSVQLLEKCEASRFHVGESFLPATIVQLERLGLLDGLLSLPHVRKPGATLVHASGETEPAHFLFSEALRVNHPWAVSLEREPFDAWLLDEARRAGVDVRQGVAVRAIETLETGDVRVRSDGAAHHARVLLDATGQARLLARRLQLLRPMHGADRVAYGAHAEGVDSDSAPVSGNTVIVMFDEGWFWLIPIDETRTSIGVVLPAGFARRSGIAPGQVLRHAIDAAPELRRRCADARLPDANFVTADFSYRCKSLAGPGYMLLGDAAGFIDPVFSGGVCVAMLSGEWAATQCIDALAGRSTWERAGGAYERDLGATLRTLQRLVDHYYTRGYQDLLLHGEGPADMPRALLELLSGASFPRMRFGARWRLAGMNACAKIQPALPLVPRQPRWSLAEQFPDRDRSTERAPRRARAAARAGAVALTLLGAGGCAQGLPSYGDLSAQEAMAIVNARPEAPRTLSAQCEIRLTDADSASVRLSGALASAPEGLRVQLWKFGQDALDMLATDAGVWATGRAADDLGEHGLPDAWRALTHRLMVGALPDDCDTLVRSGPTFQCAGSWTSESVSAEGRIAGGTIIIDARTLVPVRVEATAGEVPVMIAFDRHVLIDGRPYPRRITVAAGPRSVEIRLHDIRPGATLSDAVFRVPAGARRIGASMPPPSER